MFAKKAADPKTEAIDPKIVALPAKPLAIPRTTAGLRSMLFDELEAFLSGKTTPERARSVTTISNSIIDSARLELEFAKYVKTKGSTGKKMAVQPVRLAKRGNGQ
jgi:hypothetical protein